MAITKRVAHRIKQQLKRYQSILAEAKARDINEPDTVTILVDMLADVFGYDKFAEVTKEFAIRGTLCDLAVKVGPVVRFLIEAKAIGVPLRDIHVKQAIDYAANNAVDWVVLTNGVLWQIYKVHFKKPIDKSLVFELDVLQASPRDPQVVECLGNLTREGFTPSSMTIFYQQRQATSRFSLTATLLSEPVLKALRRQIRKLAPKLRIDTECLATILRDEVLKREVVESDETLQAAHLVKRRVSKASPKIRRAKRAPHGPATPHVAPVSVQGVPSIATVLPTPSTR